MKERTWEIYDEDTIQEMMRLWTNLDPVFERLNAEQTRAFDMTVAADQWLREWKEAYEQKGRPVSSYNLIRKSINAINAVELANRKRVVAKPTGTGDAAMTEIVTPVLHHFLYGAGFDYHRTKVFNNSIIAKFGVYHIGWSFAEDPLGTLTIDDCDPRTVRFEPNYADSTWEKAGYILRKHSMSLEELLNKFALDDLELQEALIQEAKFFFEFDPDKRNKWLTRKLKQLFTAIYETATGSNPMSSSLPQKFLNWYDPLTGKFDVLELHEKRTERRLIVNDSKRNKDWDITDRVMMDDGVRYDGLKVEQLKETYGFDGDPRTNLKDIKYLTAVVPAFRCKVNDQPYPYEITGYCYKPQYCYDYHADPLKTQSVIDDLIDPQSTYNKAQSLKLELLWRYANNGWVLDANAIDGYEQDWESGHMAPFRRVRPGYMGQIKPEQHQNVSADLIRETQELPMLMETITNTGSAMEGRGSSQDKSAKHFIAKEQQQTKSFSYLFNNVDDAAIEVAKSSWKIIQFNVTIPRMFRITQDDKAPTDIKVNQRQLALDMETGRIITKIKNDITVGDYDFEMSKTPYSGNAKEMEFMKLAELFDAAVAVNPKKADALLPIMVEEGNYPYAQKILRAWEQSEAPSPEQVQMQELMSKVQEIMVKLGIEEKKATVEGLNLDNEKKVMELRAMAINNVLSKSSYKQGSNGKKKEEKESAFQMN
jgi:hypothetical protein